MGKEADSLKGILCEATMNFSRILKALSIAGILAVSFLLLEKATFFAIADASQTTVSATENPPSSDDPLKIRSKDYAQSQDSMSFAWYHYLIIGFVSITAILILIDLGQNLLGNKNRTLRNVFLPVWVDAIDSKNSFEAHITEISPPRVTILCDKKIKIGDHLRLTSTIQIPNDLTPNPALGVVKKLRYVSDHHYFVTLKITPGPAPRGAMLPLEKHPETLKSSKA